MNLKKLPYFLVVVGFSLGIISVFAGSVFAGFRISPPKVANEHLLPGSDFEQIIYLVRGKPDKTLLASVKIDAPEIEDWIKIEQGLEFEVPKGVQQFPMKVIVNVPKEAILGTYKGTIIVNTAPLEQTKEQGGMAVRVALGAEIQIDLRISNQEFSDFSIQRIVIEDIEKESPIKLALKIQNKGNVRTGPTKVFLEVWDKYHNQLLYSKEKDISERIDPFQIKEIFVEFSNDLEEGQYWAELKIYENDEVFEQDKVVFNVLEKVKEGGLKKENPEKEMMNLGLEPEGKIDNRDCILAGVIVAILILVIGFGMFGIAYKWKKSGLKLEIKFKKQKKE